MECQVKKYREMIFLTVLLANATFPFFFELQFSRCDTRVEGEEVSQQAVELGGVVEHGEVTRTFEVDLAHVHGQVKVVVLCRWNGHGWVVRAVDEQTGNAKASDVRENVVGL